MDNTQVSHQTRAEQLRQASVSLEAAYDRIRQVRRSLLEVDRQQARDDSYEMGPAHEALVLNESVETRNVDPISHQPALPERFLSRHNRDRMSRVDEEDAQPESQPTTETSPLIRTRSPQSVPNPSPRRSLIEARLQARRNHHASLPESEQAATTLARRLRARALATAGISESSNSQLNPSPPSSLATHQVQESEEYMDLLEALHQIQPSSQRSAVAEHPTLHRLDIPADINLSASPSSGMTFASPRPYSGTRQRFRSSLARQSVSSDTSGRLSLLSSFSALNFQTPSTTVTRDRSMLLFDEPLSYTSDGLDRRDSADARRGVPISELVDGRSYIVRRRMDVNGNEVISHIAMPSETPLPPPSAARHLYTTRVRPPVNTTTAPSIARPAVITRINRASNEVEDNLERMRRLPRQWVDRDGDQLLYENEDASSWLPQDRSIQRSPLAYQGPGPNSSEQLPESPTLITATRSIIAQADGIAHVRLHHRSGRQTVVSEDYYYGIEEDDPVLAAFKTLNIECTRGMVEDGGDIILLGSSMPFKANPLPMPLPDLSSPVSDKTVHPRRQVPRRSSFAGR